MATIALTLTMNNPERAKKITAVRAQVAYAYSPAERELRVRKASNPDTLFLFAHTPKDYELLHYIVQRENADSRSLNLIAHRISKAINKPEYQDKSDIALFTKIGTTIANHPNANSDTFSILSTFPEKSVQRELLKRNLAPELRDAIENELAIPTFYPYTLLRAHAIPV